jgi:hypothetical protein
VKLALLLPRRYRHLSKEVTMRFIVATVLFLCSASAHAKPAASLDEIGGCLFLPVAAVDNHIKAVFEVTLDKAGKVTSISVESYEPHSEAAAKAALQLSVSVKRCWPPGIKTSPMRINVDLSKL